ncbi:TIR domain-containing protein [Sphingomicrobium flavum]|uniref:TIR domain-containing protein n=1 Tax=Sphingomicrobium flavum TaxID=1229164 RepID=UPI0021AE023C|nr:TIR domain-containing protein [Sphingomicrobium flavum]
MADIFLSYARADQPRIEKLAAALEEAGYSVWWDRHIRSGAEFARDIEAALKEAKAVIVAWSEHASESEWVREEASYARDHGKLVALRLDDSMPPFGYRQRQATDFSHGLFDETALHSLTEAIDALVGGAHEVEPATPRKRVPVNALVAGLLILLIGALAIMRPGPLAEIFAGEEGEAASVTLAVLPFQEIGAQAGSGRDIASRIADALGGRAYMSLVSPGTTFAAADNGGAPGDIAERVNATHFVEGDLRQDGGELKLSLRLVDAASGQPVWTRQFDRPAGQQTALVQDAVARLAAAVQARLGVGEGMLSDYRGVSPEILADYRSGMEEMLANDSDEARLAAHQYFDSVAERAPEWADAHAAKAASMIESGPNNLALSVDEFMSHQREAYERALASDPTNRWALIAKAYTATRAHGDPQTAIATARRAVELYPRSAESQRILGIALLVGGHYREALTHLDRARAIDAGIFTTPYRLLALRGLKRFNNIIEAGQACEGICQYEDQAWFDAMLAMDFSDNMLANRHLEQFEQGLSDDTEPQLLQQLIAYVRYRRLGGEPVPLPLGSPYRAVSHLGRDGDVDGAIERLRTLTNADIPADWSLNFLFDDNLSVPDNVRRDPRYAEIFDNSRFKGVEAYRREQGNLAGLPLRPGDSGHEATN